MSCPIFQLHPNWASSIQHNILQSEIEGGVYLRDLRRGHWLEVQTENRIYFLLPFEGRAVVLWGHPTYCPSPVMVRISGSTWGGSMLKVGFIGRGMHLEFRHPEYSRPITTSTIRELREGSWLLDESRKASIS